MPTQPVATRLTPETYRRLLDLVELRGTSLAATTAHLLTCALDDPASSRRPADGPLVDAVRTELADVTAPRAVIHRELAVHLARSIERREPGHLQAVRQLERELSAARTAQRFANHGGDNADEALNELLASVMTGM